MKQSIKLDNWNRIFGDKLEIDGKTYTVVFWVYSIFLMLRDYVKFIFIFLTLSACSSNLVKLSTIY